MTLHTVTPSDRLIFRQEVELFLKYPANPGQLTRAIAAHQAFLVWEQKPIDRNWAKFDKKMRAIES